MLLTSFWNASFQRLSQSPPSFSIALEVQLIPHGNSGRVDHHHFGLNWKKMQLKKCLFLLLVTACCTPTAVIALVTPQSSPLKTGGPPRRTARPVTRITRNGSSLTQTLMMPAVVTSGLQSGPLGVLALSVVTGSVVVPLTLYKKVLGTGVAHGLGVLAAGSVMLRAMPHGNSSPAHAILMAQACVFYGARSAAYMFRTYIINSKSG
eukprot:scaffold21455_cov116-Cylindrotheca_fusiformis.AAC.3